MFVGHLGVALAAKKIAPRVPLPALVASAFGLDLLWPIFLLAGWEVVRVDPGNTRFTPLDFESYPWSHSLLMSAVWGLVAAGVAQAVWRNARASVVIGAGVVSHWVLDFATHRPDLPLWPGGPTEGLGLWNSIPWTIAVEGALLAAAIAIYLRTTSSRDATGTWAFWSLIVIASATWLSGPFSPPPPSAVAIAVLGLSLAPILTAWSWWIERHRITR